MDNVDDDDIDKLKLPAALKLARERNISIRGIKDLEKIKCELKKHLLEGRRRREDVSIFFLNLSTFTLKKKLLCLLSRFGEIYI